MTLRASMNPSRVRGHFPGNYKELEPGKETSANGHEAASADLLVSPERPKVCAAAQTGVRAET
jgi:hypothetical protein